MSDAHDDVLLDQITRIFEMFDNEVKNLDKIPKDADKVVDDLLDMVLNDEDIFADSGGFLRKLMKLSDVEGHVQDTVLQIELTREKIRSPTSLLQQLQMPQVKQQQEEKLPQQIVVNAAQEPVKSSPGLTGYLTERYRWGKISEMFGRNEASPTITTTQKPRDVLDYCRDITREFNKIVDYFQPCCDMLYLFPNSQKTYDVYYTEIRMYLCKLSNIIKTFTRAIVEYRKELVGERKESYARALTLIKQAEYMATGGVQMSSLYRAMREQMGPEDAGEH